MKNQLCSIKIELSFFRFRSLIKHTNLKNTTRQYYLVIQKNEKQFYQKKVIPFSTAFLITLN